MMMAPATATIADTMNRPAAASEVRDALLVFSANDALVTVYVAAAVDGGYPGKLTAVILVRPLVMALRGVPVAWMFMVRVFEVSRALRLLGAFVGSGALSSQVSSSFGFL
jgi:hypothetical protein